MLRQPGEEFRGELAHGAAPLDEKTSYVPGLLSQGELERGLAARVLPVDDARLMLDENVCRFPVVVRDANVQHSLALWRSPVQASVLGQDILHGGSVSRRHSFQERFWRARRPVTDSFFRVYRTVGLLWTAWKPVSKNDKAIGD